MSIKGEMNMLRTVPAVFAVNREYQIMVEVEREALLTVRVGEKTYYDETNGIMNSLSPIHRVSVPMEVLDSAKEYTVCIRPLIKRKPYFTETEEPVEFTFSFKPVPEDNIRIYHISDAHNKIEGPVAAAKAFGDIDLLILNGDVIDHSGRPEKFINVYEICAALTNGNIPVVFSRGNHDMRGNFAEKFAEYTPSYLRRTYYTFQVGSIWGMLLDCGEDKDESHAAYGFTNASHCFRERQTQYIKEVIENASSEYEQEGVKTKFVIAHNPFTRIDEPPFNIESEIYSEWARLLREYIKPDLMICGHVHVCEIYPVGGKDDHLGQPCPIVVGAHPEQDCFTACGLTVKDDRFEIAFTNSRGETVSSETLKR